MKSPKEKAKELYLKFDVLPITNDQKKELVFTVIDEVLHSMDADNPDRQYWDDVEFSIQIFDPLWP